MRPNNTKHFLIIEKLFTSRFSLLASSFLLLSLFTFSFLLFNSCNTTEPGSSPQITLNFEDASSTEVWLNLHASVDLPADVKIYKDNKLSRTINIINKDTVIYEDNLLPQKSYTFRASAKLGDIELQSQNVTAVTMDTTSHNFTWQTYTFGGVNGSSVLNDVAIINENDIWAVGEIHTAETDQFDSNGVWVQPYNAVHWDGQKWELRRFYFRDFCNQQTTHVYPARAILAFSSTEIFITAGSQIINYDGNKQNTPQCIPVSVNAMWGTSSKDFYVVGNNGNIAHYNGSGWTKIESPTGVNSTDLQFLDIYGATDPKSGELQILAVGALGTPPYNSIFSISGNIATKISSYFPESPEEELFGVWFIPNRHYYVIGDGIYEKHFLTDNGWKNGPLKYTTHSTTRVRGQGLNDIIIVGAFGEVLHFNGISWRSYINETALNNGSYSGLSYKGNLVVTVGANNALGVITVGKR